MTALRVWVNYFLSVKYIHFHINLHRKFTFDISGVKLTVPSDIKICILFTSLSLIIPIFGSFSGLYRQDPRDAEAIDVSNEIRDGSPTIDTVSQPRVSILFHRKKQTFYLLFSMILGRESNFCWSTHPQHRSWPWKWWQGRRSKFFLFTWTWTGKWKRGIILKFWCIFKKEKKKILLNGNSKL